MIYVLYRFHLLKKSLKKCKKVRKFKLEACVTTSEGGEIISHSKLSEIFSVKYSV